ncbi:MAG: LuxR C-terminal-related transcriptional regulator [Acidobacteriia bacterium]|nr:LuxR C-terminal-related transcriptional regulator [Terriglobia bacterium]
MEIAILQDNGPQQRSIPALSSRERQVVALIQQAKSNKEIAYELSLTVGTVKEYIYHIFRKIGVSNRTELALWGRDYLAETVS